MQQKMLTTTAASSPELVRYEKQVKSKELFMGLVAPRIQQAGKHSASPVPTVRAHTGGGCRQSSPEVPADHQLTSQESAG